MVARCVIRRDGGIDCIGKPTVSNIFQTVPSAQVPRATSVLFILIQVGAFFGVAISALILQRSRQAGDLAHAFGNAFWWVVVASIVVFVASLSLQGRVKRDDSVQLASSTLERVAGD